MVVTPRTASVGRTTRFRVRAVALNGRALRSARVTVRGAGVSASARTSRTGLALLNVRPKRIGLLTFRAAASRRCVSRIGVASAKVPLTG